MEAQTTPSASFEFLGKNYDNSLTIAYWNSSSLVSISNNRLPNNYLRKLDKTHMFSTIHINLHFFLSFSVGLLSLPHTFSQYLPKPWPTYSLDNMPRTGFSCQGKILGGYYADPETQCQMFHVCVKVAGVGVSNDEMVTN